VSRIENRDYGFALTMKNCLDWVPRGARSWHSWDKVSEALTQSCKRLGYDGNVRIECRPADASDAVVVGDRLHQFIPVTISWDEDCHVLDDPADWPDWDTILHYADTALTRWTGDVHWDAGAGLVQSYEPALEEDPDLC
jgi:hypothetical protein